MPFKVNRGRYDAIHPNNVTGYYFAGTRNKRYPIPGEGENKMYGVTGYITTCGRLIGGGRGEWNQCIDGYDEITYIYNKEGVIDDTSQVFGDETYNTELLANRGESNFISYTAPGATQNQAGNICQQGTVDGCKCIDRHDRRVCRRNLEKKPYGGDPIKCCLESDTNKLMEMDCDPKYFKTTDNLDVSEACHVHKERFCKDTSAFNASSMEITAEYVDFCGCDYPQEYYDNIAQNIIDSFPGITLGQLGPNPACYAPTCVKADEAVKPISNYECPANNFQSCIQSIELKNNGIIDGNITVDGTIECQQFYDTSVSNIEGGGSGGIINHFYTCEGDKCIRDDENGEYNNDKCDNKCENIDESNNIWIWVLVIILILVLVGSGLYLIFSDNSNNKTEIAYIQE